MMGFWAPTIARSNWFWIDRDFIRVAYKDFSEAVLSLSSLV